MLLAKRLNRVYKISENEKVTYLKRGFDIVDEEGKLVEAAMDKTISYNEHMKEINALSAKLEEAGKVPNNAKALKEQVETLVAEKKELLKENEALKEQVETLTKGETDGKVQK